MRRWNIRTRLTLLFAALQVLLALLFSASVYWQFGEELMAAIDRNLRDKAETLAAAYEFDGEDIEVELDEHSVDTFWPDAVAQIRDPAGRVLFQNLPGEPVPFPPPPVAEAAQSNAPVLYAADLPKRGERRCVWRADAHRGRPVVVAISMPLSTMRAEQHKLLRVIGLTSGGVVLVSSLLGWFVIGRLLRPLAAMAAKAKRITAERLGDRLAVRNPHDEIGQLATTLNDMIERLGASFERMRRFTSDASHELRTPLTCMRSEVDVALQQPRTLEEYQDLLGSILEETQRLTRLSDALLTLTRADAGGTALQRETVDVPALLTEAADRVRVQADAKGKTLDVPDDAPPCRVVGDRRLLHQVLVNVLDNAVKYGGTKIRADVRQENGVVAIAVHDSGPGIPAEHIEHLFERFYRVEKSRSRELGGVGLGLSLAKHLVELHGGRITARSSHDEGTTFEVLLPEAAG